MTIKEKQISELALFRGCRRADIEWLAKVADILDLPAGQTLAIEGKRVREFVVLVEGSAAGMGAGGDVVLRPGAYFGEMGLVDGRPYTMTVTSLEPVRLLVFEARVFRSLLDRIPSVGRKLMADLVTRLRNADQPARSLRAVS